jgi:CheY-like chemotaxis protein
MPPKRIIIVEDEGIVAMDISKCLSSLGYEIAFIADTGEKILERIETEPADLILMDVELKGAINGLETAKTLKEKYDTPIIFLTAFEDEGTLEKINKLSSDGYLVKPFEDENLKITIERILNKA